jgi:hypothetical protein
MITFIDQKHVKPTMVRGREVYGWTWQKVGFQHVGQTKTEGLLAFQLIPARMPRPCRALQ